MIKRLFNDSFLKYPLLISLITTLAVFSFHCAKREGDQKIKLDSAAIREAQASSKLATTLQVEPEDRRSLAVFYFDNVTGDKELDWMRRGLMEMLITDLSQSRYVDVFGEHDLASIMRRMGIAEDRDMDPNLAVRVAREAHLETVLVGSYVRLNGTIRADVQLYDARTGSLLKDERVECGGMEEVFTMVDELTRRVRDGLRPTLKDVAEFDKELADATTTSIEAYRYFARGLELADKYYLGEAAEQFEKAVEIDTTFATAYSRLATTYAGMSQGRSSRKALMMALLFIDRVTEWERLNIIAFDAQLKGDTKALVESFEKMIQLNPRDKEAHYRLASIYRYMRRDEDAIREYEAALDIDNTYIHPYNELGYLYAKRGEIDKGVALLRKYMELAPDQANPHDSIGEIYLTAGRFDEAIDELKQALKKKSDFHYSWEKLGIISMDKGDYDQAIRNFRQYIEVCPSGYLKSYGQRMIGEGYWARGEYESALKSFQEALKMYPDNFGMIPVMGSLYKAKGDTVEARKFREEWFSSTAGRILEEDNFDVVRFFVQTALLDSLHPEELDPHIDKMMDLSENESNIALSHYCRGVSRLLVGKTNEALVHFRRCLPPLFAVEARQGLSRYALKNIARALANSSLSPQDHQAFIDDVLALAKKVKNPVLEASARYLALEYFQTVGDEQAVERELKATGTPHESMWWILGPFEGDNGLHHRFPPERKIDLTRTYKGKGKEIGWRQAGDDVLEGYIDLCEILDPDEWTVAFGFLSFDCPTVRQAQLRFGSNEAARIWLNDEEVWIYNFRREAILDDDIIPVELQEGKNTVLVKIGQKVGGWGFHFRITDPEGHPFGDITYLPPVIS